MAERWTDKQLDIIENRIEKEYRKAAHDIYKKWDKYMKNAEKRIQHLQQAYDAARLSGIQADIEQAEKALQEAKKNKTLKNRWYREMLNETTRHLANTNAFALAYVNGELPDIYLNTFNQLGREAHQIGLKFNLVDENTVARLIRNEEITLPRKKLSVPKDMQWNRKQINSSVLQGILQGESMSNIAKRILPIVGNNKNSAIRNARTLVTGAENAGRLDGYRQLSDYGVIQRRVWMATGDEKTRDWHLSLDGQEKELDEPFIDGLGNEIMYPGDPDAPGVTVWQCRCSMRTRIIGIQSANGKITPIPSGQGNAVRFHEIEIQQERARRGV